ncbi:MAG: protein-disulfide reductase DsbD domain-containing protein [Pseudomonadales bacterium]|jgi:thiol:disulfide interchange protein DsbD|nr:protein-disulfide reductase DsbD domain-containing protein [Pseudomonadales bacterium]
MDSGVPRRLLGALALLASIIHPAPTQAEVLEAHVTTPRLEASLFAEHAVVVPGTETAVQLRLDLPEHWHTYWRFSGDSGERTRIEWTLPEGVTAAPIAWPTPSRVPMGPVMNYGYEHVARHLIPLHVDDSVAPDRSLRLVADATWLVCREACIPESGHFELELRTGARAMPAGFAADFEAVRTALPSPSPFAYDATTPGRVDFRGAFDAATLQDAYLYADAWGQIEPSAPQRFSLTETGLRIEYTAGPLGGFTSGVLVLSERSDDTARRFGFAVGESGPVAAAKPARAAAAVAPAPGLALALLLAFVGGLVLNLMPCVLPVLSVKLLALSEHAHGSPGRLRAAGLAWTAGVLSCFAVLGVVLVMLRTGGEAVGWGFQLQDPRVVALLALLFFWLGLALSGFVEIGVRVMGLAAAPGEGVDEAGIGGSFLTGLLAAVVATPCTAPFMGVAVGWALLQPTAEALAVMLALGAGMAAPFLALCFAPGLLRRLPRPGPWMVRLRELFAFPLYGAAVWLLWVLARQSGADAVAATLAAMVAIAFFVWLAHAVVRARSAAALAPAVLAVALAAAIPTEPRGDEAGAGGFDVARIETLRSEGRPVFLNLTAAWCVTCLVNERVALSTGAVEAAIVRNGIAYVEGDWTGRDPAITALLERFGRAGVPLYVLYPPRGEPRVLPQLLTPELVVAALDELGSS